jgi:osmotically-inducible protein OsmY
VQLLAEVARRPEFATTDAATELVADRVVASQVEVALAGHPDMRRYRIDVESTRGLVTLELPAGVDPDAALAVARGVAGVRDVKLRIAELPVATPFPG